MKARLFVVGALTALLAVLSAGPLVAPATSGGVAPAAVMPVSGLTALVAGGSVDLGQDASAPAKVVLGLSLRDQAGLRAVLHQEYTPGSVHYHHFLTPEEFAARFGPEQATVDALIEWASRAGLVATTVSANRTLVTVEGPAGALGPAFGTALHRFRAGNGTAYLAATHDASLPAALGGKVDDVVGLNGLSHVVFPPRPAARSAQVGLPVSYGPQDLWAAYHAPAGQTGQGQTVAILAQGDVSQAQTDLVTFEKTFHVPQVPWTTIRTGPATNDTSGTQEWDLDTQYATGMAPGVSRLLVYDAPSMSDPDALAEINRWVTDDRAPEASASWGECETQAQTSGLLRGGDKALLQAVTQGQTLFAASGDNGAFCSIGLPNGVPLGGPGLSYPASSPYAVAVGGTTLITGLPRPLAEVSWLAGGGGISLIEPVPDYQQSAGGSFLPLKRGAPDVALDADVLTGYQVISKGALTTTGGTSASSPAWLGIWARAQAAHAGALGFANRTIYREPASSFYDIVIGTDVPFVATPGWDYTTGRGSADITAFAAAAS
jgi:pseudomonalisin/xanthomonalisin